MSTCALWDLRSWSYCLELSVRCLSLSSVFCFLFFLFVVFGIKPEPGPCACWASALPLSYIPTLWGVAVQHRLPGLLRLGLKCGLPHLG